MTIFRNLSYLEYAALPGVRSSCLTAAAESGLAYKHACDHPRTSKAFAFGKLAHTEVLEPQNARYVVVPDFGPLQFKANKAAWSKWWFQQSGIQFSRREEAEEWSAGREYVTHQDVVLAHGVADAVWKHTVAASTLDGGDTEITLQWTDDETGLECKARIDRLNRSIVDLKTCAKLTKFEDTVPRYWYDVQAAFYRRGVAACLGKRLPVHMVAVQKTDPIDVGVFSISEQSLDRADSEVSRLLRRIADWTWHDEWPGAFEEEREIIVPDYVRRGEEDEDDTIMIGGQTVAL
jgi:exodeoxyribonuclease VIII